MEFIKRNRKSFKLSSGAIRRSSFNIGELKEFRPNIPELKKDLEETIAKYKNREPVKEKYSDLTFKEKTELLALKKKQDLELQKKRDKELLTALSATPGSRVSHARSGESVKPSMPSFKKQLKADEQALKELGVL